MATRRAALQSTPNTVMLQSFRVRVVERTEMTINELVRRIARVETFPSDKTAQYSRAARSRWCRARPGAGGGAGSDDQDRSAGRCHRRVVRDAGRAAARHRLR